MRVTQVLLLDLEEQLSAERSQMPKFLNDFAVILLLDGELGVCLGISFGDVLFILSVVNMVGVGESWIFGLVHCVEEFEDEVANELVISVYFQGDGVIFAVVVNSVVQISQRSFSLLSLHHHCPFLRNPFSPQIPLNQHSRLVLRMIVNDDHQVVAIILVEDGLQVVNIPMVLYIIPSWNHHAHRDLMEVLVNIVLILIGLVLGLHQIVHLLCMVVAILKVVVWILDVVEGQTELTSVLVVLLAKALYSKVAFDDFVGLLLTLQELQVKLGGLESGHTFIQLFQDLCGVGESAVYVDHLVDEVQLH